MSKKLLIVIGILLLGLMAWMGYFSFKKLEHRGDTQLITQDFNFLAVKLGIENLDFNKPSSFIYFNSNCHLCHQEMKEIGENIDKFQTYQLLLASFEPKSEAQDFLRQYNLAKHYVEVNPDSLTSTIIGGVPQTFIYKDGKLAKHFKGEVKIEVILEVLE